MQAFIALEADRDCVGLEAFLNGVDGSVEGIVEENPGVNVIDWSKYVYDGQDYPN